MKLTKEGIEIKKDGFGEYEIVIFDCDDHPISNKEQASAIKQQILENQQIVDIVKCWAQTEPISTHNDIELTHEQLETRRWPVYRLINLIRDKTGVNIGESS
ncbi:MAG: hypothetical protein O6761_05845 [Thaumarchaeota archaeon]|nr:hypothetical protein [Nitrososphaerota archaeon]